MFTRSPRAAGGLALLTIGALLLAGCGRSNDVPAGVDDGFELIDGPATGELSVWAMGNEGELLPDFVAAFEEANPDVSITVTSVPWGEARQKLETAIAGGQVPDLSLVDLGYMPGFVASAGLLPVPEGVADPDAFFDAANAAVTFEGTAYAVPWYISSRVLLYRADLAEAAGVAAPQTWDEYYEFAQALKNAGAQTGALLPFGQFNAWQQVLPFFWQAGGEVIDSDGEFQLGSDAMVRSLTFLQSFYEAGLATAEGPIESGASQAGFVGGQWASMISGPWERASLTNAGGEEFVENDLGLVMMPEGPAGLRTAYAGGGALAVFRDAKNPDAAFKLIQWLSTPEVQSDWYDVSGDLPAVESVWAEPALADDDFITVFGDQLADAQGPPAIPTWAEIGAVIDGIAERLARGTITPEDAAAEIQRRAESIGTGQ